MLCCAVLVLAAAVSTVLTAETPAPDPAPQPAQPPQPQHVMHVPTQQQQRQEAQDRTFKVLASGALIKGTLHKGFGKGKLKPKFPFGLKEKVLGALGLGTAATVAAGATGAVGAGAVGAGAVGAGGVGLHGLDFSNQQGVQQYPIWKVHRYQGLELRPIRLAAPAGAGPGPYPYPPEEPQHVQGPPPKEIAAPVPVYGAPVPAPPSTYGPPAETYGPPAQTYGPPAETYGPPAQTYGPPAQTYGPPAQTYGPPAQTYGPPAETYGPPAETDSSNTGSGDSLEALSNLGALTDFLPGGSTGAASAGGGAFGAFSSLLGASGRSKGNILSLISNAKTIVPNFIKSAVPPPGPAPAENIVYHPPPPSRFSGFVQNIPGLSHIVNTIHGGGDYVNLPPLPELPKLPSVVGLKEIPAIPALPLVKLPTKLVAQGGTYVRVVPNYIAGNSAISPRNPVPAAPPASPSESLQQPMLPAETYAQPSNPEYTLPLEQQVSTASAGQVVNSYGQPVGQEAHAFANSVQQYSTPVQQYSAPVQQYSAPVQQYSAPVQQYSTPVQQYSTPVQQYSAPVQQYSAPVQQYSAPVQYSTAVQQYANPTAFSPSTQYAGVADAFTSASAPEPASSDPDGHEQGRNSNADDDERVDLSHNTRSDYIDAASEASEVRVPAPQGETHAVGQRADTTPVSPVFNREEHARRLEEMRQMVDQVVQLATQLDSDKGTEPQPQSPSEPHADSPKA